MKITKVSIECIRQRMNNLSQETGGIMGSADGETISEIIIDRPNHATHRCFYAPNVQFFNECIAKWQREGKYFMGMFHTHFHNVKTLSEADTAYITAIMNAMPCDIKELFFPVFVLPNQEFVCFKATREDSSIILEQDTLEII